MTATAPSANVTPEKSTETGPDGPGPAASKLEREVRLLQRDHRVPSVAAAVRRPGRAPWAFELSGIEDVDASTQFRIGSITKTFTAVLIMQGRDAGLLGLDDPISRFLAVPEHGDLTVRRLLSHTSGLQREPHGNLWDELFAPDDRKLLEDMARAEAVLPNGRRWHYSNLGFSILGLIAATIFGDSWAKVVNDRLIGPLGLTRTTLAPTAPHAQGYLVEAFSDHVRSEPHLDFGAVDAAGQLWSTASDMARWAAFLADPDPAILAPSTVDEMVTPVTVTDEREWVRGWGLGLMLVPRGGRMVQVGHTGGMPGFIAGMFVDRAERVGAAVLGSSSTAGAISQLPHRLIEVSLEADPPDIEPWRPGAAEPAELVGMLGHWWSEGTEFTFSYRAGHLEARQVGQPEGRPPSVFEPIDVDVYRAESGAEAGEILRVNRDKDGAVVDFHWATYRFTRDQRTFGQHLSAE